MKKIEKGEKANEKLILFLKDSFVIISVLGMFTLLFIETLIKFGAVEF